MHKNKKIAIIFFAVILSVIQLFASSPVNSDLKLGYNKHNLSSGSANPIKATPGSEDEICIFCHTPHKNVGTYVNWGTFNILPFPLWNRSMPAPKVYTVYASATLNSTPANPPSSVSLLCMSCHDGSTAINALINYSNHGTPAMANGVDQIGDMYYPGAQVGYPGPNIGGAYSGNWDMRDLRDDHPVSFVYSTSADGGLKPPSNFDGILKLYGPGNNMVECSTCHDVHERGDEIVDLTYPFLRTTIDESTLCTLCHNK